MRRPRLAGIVLTERDLSAQLLIPRRASRAQPLERLVLSRPLRSEILMSIGRPLVVSRELCLLAQMANSILVGNNFWTDR
jgi:hypothetical protein